MSIKDLGDAENDPPIFGLRGENQRKKERGKIGKKEDPLGSSKNRG